jgi:transposase
MNAVHGNPCIRDSIAGAVKASGGRCWLYFEEIGSIGTGSSWMAPMSALINMPMGQKKSVPSGQAIGKSRGGPTTKIHLLCDGQGRPIHFRLSAGNVADCTEAIPLLEGAPGEGQYTVADKGYDGDEIRDHIIESGSKPVIPYKKNRKHPGRLKRKIYRLRHKVENGFCSLKRFRSIATRYEKLARNFAGMVAMACVFMWLKD